MEQGREAWDVAVACDIRLGETFRYTPDLWGAELEIDPNAIQETLRALPGYRPQDIPLLVTVTHEDTMHASDAMGHCYTTRRGKIVNHKPDAIRIDISLGNLSRLADAQATEGSKFHKASLKAISTSNLAIQQAVGDILVISDHFNGTSDISEQVELIKQARKIGRKYARSLGCFIMPEYDGSSLRPGVEVPRSPGSPIYKKQLIQETAVHELQHAVDKMNPTPSDTYKQRKVLARLYGWRAMAVFGIFGSSQVLYEKLEDALYGDLPPAVNLLSAMGGVALSYAAALQFANKIGNTEWLDEQYQERSVWEQRAEAAEDMAKRLPPIVRLVKRSSEVVTPVSIR